MRGIAIVSIIVISAVIISLLLPLVYTSFFNGILDGWFGVNTSSGLTLSDYVGTVAILTTLSATTIISLYMYRLSFRNRIESVKYKEEQEKSKKKYIIGFINAYIVEIKAYINNGDTELKLPPLPADIESKISEVGLSEELVVCLIGCCNRIKFIANKSNGTNLGLVDLCSKFLASEEYTQWLLYYKLFKI